MPSTQRVIECPLSEQLPANTEVGSLDFAYDKKSLGAFYTPKIVADLLTKWAIRSNQDQVLEPGFGGCEFLEAAINRLLDLGCSSPKSQLIGCDIDSTAFGYLADKLGTVALDGRYLYKDFLEVRPEDFLTGNVDVAIGNPPYVSHHNMSLAQKASTRKWRAQYQMQISGRSSLWAYFILHAAQFLKPRGRMAWVLPGSLVHSNYGRDILNIVARQFSRTYTLALNERVFLSVGTEEKTVVLLCDGLGLPANAPGHFHCDDVSHLSAILSRILLHQEASRVAENAISYSAYHSISEKLSATRLSDLARVLIGTVTGANKFFVLSPSRAQQFGISERYLRPIVAKFGDLEGAKFADADIERLREKDKSCLLFFVPDQRISDAVKSYIDSFPEEERLANSTFSRRTDWLAADDGRAPDAFLSYMIHTGPRIVLNNAGVNCTNTVHRVYFNEAVTDVQRKLACISLCTTFSQLSAEIEGRSYGSGVLKLEPTEARRIQLHIPDNYTADEINRKFEEFDSNLRSHGIERIRALADNFIFSNASPEISGLLKHAESELLQARKLRIHQRHGK